MKDPNLKHNYKVKLNNLIPATVPDPVEDLKALIAEYNQAELFQEQRLARIWATMAKRSSSTRFIAFGGDRRLTTNNFKTDLDRPDLTMGRTLEGFTSFITDFDLGE